MNSYSVKVNIKAIGWVFTQPEKLINSITSMPLMHGIVTFVTYLVLAEIAWLLAWSAGIYEAVNPLPNLLSIADSDYPLYMVALGPITKILGVFIFIGMFRILSSSNVLDTQAYRALINLYMLVGSTLAAVALILEQLFVWGGLSDVNRIVINLLYFGVVVITIIYLVGFVSRQINYSRKRAIYTVVPAIILSGLLPALLFR